MTCILYLNIGITQGIKNYDLYLGQKQSLNSSKTLGGKLQSKTKTPIQNRVFQEMEKYTQEKI